MVRLFLVCATAAAPLGGCAAVPWFQPAGAALAVNVAAIPVIQRTIPDAIYSTLTGRDCSIVRLDKGETYCRQVEPPPAPPPYCTRSLARVDCWNSPAQLPRPQAGVADGPMTLTPAQEADRVRRWPL